MAGSAHGDASVPGTGSASGNTGPDSSSAKAGLTSTQDAECTGSAGECAGEDDPDEPLEDFRRCLAAFKKDKTVVKLRAWSRALELVRNTRSGGNGKRMGITRILNGCPARGQAPLCPMATVHRWNGFLKRVDVCHDKTCYPEFVTITAALSNHKPPSPQREK